MPCKMDGRNAENCAKREVNLFQQMETERARIPHMTRDDYLPVFIVKCLREKLAPADEDTNDMIGNRGKRLFNPFAKSTEDSMWTDDTILEENLDFEGHFLLSKENLNYVGKILKFTKSAVECLKVNKNRIGRHFTDDFEYPCLELLYLMDSFYNIMPLSSYLFWLKEPSQINYFKQQFLSFCFSPVAFSEDNRERSYRILQKFLQCIILSHYCNPCSKPNLQKLKDNTGEIIRMITAKLISKDSTQVSYSNHKTVIATLKDVDIPKSVRTRYIAEQINIILRSGSKPFHAELKVLQCQEQYADPTVLLNSEALTLTISHMISALSSNEIFEIISSTLATSDFNWEILLFFITVWVRDKQNSANSLLKDLCKSYIQNGLATSTESDVTKGFIIARHCSVVASEIFLRYEKWFANMFNSEAYSVAKESERFRFLIETLTKWIPVEPSCFLLVHATYWPFVPKGCREVWSDYVAIAKARISEVKEVEEAMEFEPNLNDPIHHEVEMAVKKFESTGSLPSSVIKMSIFSREHYLTNFLPVLLRKPTNVALTDSRLRFIEVLNQSKKIPEKMYQAYKSGAS